MPAGESEARAKTRERFNEVFKRYNDAPSNKTRLKEKPPEGLLLQTLKNNIDKDTEEDETVLQNRYDTGQASPHFTKNKRREREIVETTNNSGDQDEAQPSKIKTKIRKRGLPSVPGHDNTAIQITEAERNDSIVESDDAGKVQNRKGKKPKSKETTIESSKVEAEDNLLQQYQRQIAQEEERTVNGAQVKTDSSSSPRVVKLNNEVRKKKKNLRSLDTDGDTREQDKSQDQDLDVENKTITKGKKKRRRKQVVNEESETEVDLPQKPTFDDSLVLGVYIHRTDRLKTDLMVSHPMVKVHVIDEVTGQYVKKEDSHRPVSSFYEQENVDHILPIITQPFDFKKNKSTIPEWEEQIIYNERFGYFIQDDYESPRVMLFFEILDFMTMEEARANADVDRQERGFRKIAWAFLKLVGTNGVLNIDSKLRLQLYCPPARTKRQPKTIEVVDWWQRCPRSRYSSTLYITVKGIKLPDHVDPCIRSMMALQQERGSTSYSELQSEVSRRTMTQPLDKKTPILKWSRIPGQVCRIPNKPMVSFRGGQMGCFTVCFSHNGMILAAACADRDAFPVVVYEIPSGEVLAAFNGHLSIVYDLCWSRDDQCLLSASSDGTVREWNVEKMLSIAQKVLPHPSFVYCAQYHPMARNLVVTGGYDCLIRVWGLDVRDVYGQLLQELEGHETFVNAACFDCEGKRLFSADNAGVIIVWRTTVNDRSSQRPCQHWEIERKIDEKDLNGIPINHLQVHRNGRRLLIHAKDSVVRVMDLRILAVKTYTGATNYREKIYSTFTPCGSFIFSGSEDGMAYVWNAETGDQVAVYSELCYPTALRGVAFHPHENMVAFCAFGQNQPVHVYLYDHKVSQLEVESIKGLSRTMSTDTKPFRTPSDAVMVSDRTASSIDQFAQATEQFLKLQAVKDKLDSVLESQRTSSALGYEYEKDKVSLMARSLTLDAAGTMGLNGPLTSPSLMSPHSKLQLCSTMGGQLIPQASQSGGFSPVGQRLSRAPSLRLQTSFPDNCIRVEADSIAPAQQNVVSLYDYSANRSDELTVHRGDVIQVLYKDNDSWWFGRLASGQQGYFPATYVAEERDSNAETRAMSEQTEPSVDRSTPTKVSAAISASGELKFISEQDTEPELADTKVKKKKKKVKKSESHLSQPQVTSSDAELSSSTGRKRTVKTADRPLPRRPTGKASSGLEPDL